MYSGKVSNGLRFQIDVLNASDPHSPFLTQYCFDAHYVDKILTEGYRFNESGFGNIRFKKDVSKVQMFGKFLPGYERSSPGAFYLRLSAVSVIEL